VPVAVNAMIRLAYVVRDDTDVSPATSIRSHLTVTSATPGSRVRHPGPPRWSPRRPSGIAHGLDRGCAPTANRRQLIVLTQPNPSPADGRPVRPRVAALLAVGCLIVAAFQAGLTLGAPFGAAALGGANAGQLPGPLRLVTGFATVVWLLAALLVLTRGGSRHSPVTTAVASVGTWALACLLGVGALMNFASSSPWERFGWGPFTLVMFVLGVVLARSGFASDRPTRATGR
jgi:hypothetical protein